MKQALGVGVFHRELNSVFACLNLKVGDLWPNICSLEINPLHFGIRLFNHGNVGIYLNFDLEYFVTVRYIFRFYLRFISL